MALDLDQLIALRLLEGTDPFVVQIGAFDGRTGDQIHQWITTYGWHGILVEPQPRYFSELQRTYVAQPGLTLRNVAISEKRETRTLYTIREDVPGLPEWAPQVASFDRAVVDGHGLRGPGGEHIVEPYEVECLPLSDLLRGVDRIDLLQIDVEGYDAEIVRMFDFDTYRPRIVRFENRHLARPDHDGAVRRLLDHGYFVALTGPDTIAWHQT
jgi:FkbM family methyltransferase